MTYVLSHHLALVRFYSPGWVLNGLSLSGEEVEIPEGDVKGRERERELGGGGGGGGMEEI